MGGIKLIEKEKKADRWNNTESDYNNGEGVKDPIAVILKDKNSAYWYFTRSQERIAKAYEVIYGSTADILQLSVEKYLGIPEHPDHLIFTLLSTDSKGNPIHIREVPHPYLTLRNAEDIVHHLDLIDKYGKITVVQPERRCGGYWHHDFSKPLEDELLLRNYIVEGGVIYKDEKKIKSRLVAATRSAATFRVCDIWAAAAAVESMIKFEDRAMASSTTRKGIAYMSRLLALLAIVERAHGKNSRRRLIPFQKMIAKWKKCKYRTGVFSTEDFKIYTAWLDKEAAKRRSRAKPITDRIDLVNSMM